MAKKSFFHGTSASHLKAIKRNGLLCETSKIWNASRNEIYFWSPDELVKGGDAEEDWKEEAAKERAYDSAQVAMAIDPKSNGRCIVLEVELEESEVAEDDSCSNMQGAVSVSRDIKPSEIKAIYLSPNLGAMTGYFVAQVIDNELFDSTLVSESTKKIAKIFRKSEFYFDSSDFPLEKMR